MGRVRIGGLEHQPVKADRKRRQLGPVGAALAKAEQLQVIGREHHQVVHRTQRVMPARGQPEAEPGENSRRLVHAVAHIDHDVIEDRRGARHVSSPALNTGRQ